MRRIRFTHKRNPGVWGLAFPEQFRIELDPDLEDKTEIDIALHEGLHCLMPWLAEETVNEAGKTLADLLWRMGYRRKEDE
jgi:hypothetical protein